MKITDKVSHKILGIVGGMHSCGIAYIENGEIKVVLEEERINRIKPYVDLHNDWFRYPLESVATLADKYDTLVTNLEGKEKAIYQKLISKDKLLTTEMNKLKNIEQEIDSQQGDVPETLSQQIEDSTFNLINDNYNFILWTILAIGIIIAAIHFGRKIKK